MKKTVPFSIFGNETGYLSLNIKDLINIENTINKSIIEFCGELENGRYTLSDIIKCLPIAYKGCLLESGEKAMTQEECSKKMEIAFENGDSIMSVSIPLYLAVLGTGFFGKKQIAVQSEQTEKQ